MQEDRAGQERGAELLNVPIGDACKTLSWYSDKLMNESQQVQLSDTDRYEALCAQSNLAGSIGRGANSGTSFNRVQWIIVAEMIAHANELDEPVAFVKARILGFVNTCRGEDDPELML